MSDPDPNQPQQPAQTDNGKQKSRLDAVYSGARKATVGWIQPGLNDWMRFVWGQVDPPFHEGQTFEQELPRLFRLLATVGLLSGSIVGVKEVFGTGGASPMALVLQSRPDLLPIGVIVALFYLLSARLCRVPITPRQAFFTIMLLGIPWIPLVGVVASFDANNLVWGPFVWIICFYVFPLVLLSNFSRGIRSINPKCNKWLIRGSFAVPIILGVALFLLVGTRVPNSTGQTTDSRQSKESAVQSSQK